jgi:hypothetical protein
MPDGMTSLGVGGIFVVLLLRELSAFLKSLGYLQPQTDPHSTPMPMNGDLVSTRSGDRPVEFWQKHSKEAISDALRLSVIPILEQQALILGELRLASTREAEMMIRFQYVLDELKSGQTNIRASLHDLRDKMQIAVLSVGGRRETDKP